MDTNYPNFTNTSYWEDQILQEQVPSDDALWNNHYSHQSHQMASSSSRQVTSSDFYGDHQVGISLEMAVDGEEQDEEEEEELGAMKEMMFKIAAMQPVDIDPATVTKPKRRNVRISDDPQSVAARLRREKISEKIRILQRLVPGGTKMDTASMLDEAIRYVKFLKKQIRILQSNHHQPPSCIGITGKFTAVEWPIPPTKAGGATTSTTIEPHAQHGNFRGKLGNLM